MTMPFVPGRDAEVPESYGMVIHFNNGKKEEYDIASHFLNKETKLLEFVTKDDEWHWVPLIGVYKFVFDKRFSKLVELSQKRKENALRAV